MGRALRLLRALPSYARVAAWALSRRVSGARDVHQAVIVDGSRVALSLRPDVQGWELPGGSARPGETSDAAARREVQEETGLEVEVEGHVGDYLRSGIGAHRARIYRCRVRGGVLRPSAETPAVAWFDVRALPRTLLPWYRGPLADALAGLEALEVHEAQGWRHWLAAISIDLRLRWRGPERDVRAGERGRGQGA